MELVNISKQNGAVRFDKYETGKMLRTVSSRIITFPLTGRGLDELFADAYFQERDKECRHVHAFLETAEVFRQHIGL